MTAAGLQGDLLATSVRWSVAKPDRLFFKKIIECAGMPATAIAYVGDRLEAGGGQCADAARCDLMRSEPIDKRWGLSLE